MTTEIDPMTVEEFEQATAGIASTERLVVEKRIEGERVHIRIERAGYPTARFEASHPLADRIALLRSIEEATEAARTIEGMSVEHLRRLAPQRIRR